MTAAQPQSSGRRVVWTAGLIVAAAAGVATAHGLYQVAAAARVPTLIAWLYPLITDGLALVAYAATGRLAHGGRRYAAGIVVLAAGLSGLAQAIYLTGGLGQATTAPTGLRFGVGAWPAIAAALTAHLLHLIGVSPAADRSEPLTATSLFHKGVCACLRGRAGRVGEDSVVGFNFIAADRDQVFLLPADMRDWLPADHLAWFVIDVVDQLDLSRFRGVYRADGHGRAAYDPAVLVALLLYAYCTGIRSSRVIERRCREDIAFRVLAGGLMPDHVTLARFRSRHANALAAVFVQSLRLCAQAGLLRLGAVALDGTKIGADARADKNKTLAQLEELINDMLAESAAVDAAEDARDSNDAPLPPDLVSRERRLDRLRRAKAQLEAEAKDRADRFAQRSEQTNAARAAKGLPPIQLRPRRRDEAPRPQATVNPTDLDSRLMRTVGQSVQGYNAQLVATAEQIIIAAEVSQDANDVEQLAPMLSATRDTLTAAGITKPIRRLAADAGYWRAANIDGSIPDAPKLFIAVAKHGRRGKPRKDGRPSTSKTDDLVAAMQRRLDTKTGKRMMRMRATTVEPLFGQTKGARGIRRFTRRGLPAAQAEWKLIAATSNLLKLYRASLRPA